MKLTFAWGDNSQVPAEGVLSVAKNCPRLRVFDLFIPTYVNNYTPTNGRSITDDTIKQVATSTALLHLGDLCTDLTECILIGDFNMEELCRPKVAPVLPQLRNLRLYGVSDNISRRQAKSILDQACPNLRSLEF